MYCKKCGNFFQPSPEEERLIVAGHAEEVCLNCEKEAWLEQEKDREDDAPPVMPGREYVGDGRELFRAEWFRSNGRSICFIALPLLPLRPKMSPLRRPRPHDIHVHVFSVQNRQFTSMPRTHVQSNWENFRETNRPFWVRKRPSFQDAFTGISDIEIPAKRILEVKKSGHQVRLDVDDGSYVILSYR